MAATKTAKALDPLAQREELRRQLAHANEVKEKAQAALSAVKREHGASEGPNHFYQRQRDIADTHLKMARGLASEKDLEKAKQRLKDAEEAWERGIESNKIAIAAVRQVQAEIADLHNAHTEAFIEDARKLSDEAHAALAEVIDSYTRAAAAWKKAQARWSEFTGDVPELSPTPRWPFPKPHELAGARCLPPQVDG